MANTALRWLSWVLTLSIIQTVSANLIGFDFGSSYMKATLVKAGSPFAIIENTASKRKTENMVSLGQENRLFGANSYLESGKYPKTTFSEMARTFGRKYEESWVESFKGQYYIFNEMVPDDRGLIQWKIKREKYGDQPAEDELLFPEEIVAMMFEYVQMLAEK